MTPEEAIYVIKEYKPILGFEKYREALNVAISALEEIQQYREIGTVEECREAVEKQKPKIPDYEGDGYADGYMVYDTWICPDCGNIAYAGKSCSRMTAPGHMKYLWCAHCKEIKNMVQIEKI